MRETERLERAFVLQQMRLSGRLPYWFDDWAIKRAFQLERIEQPPRIKRANRAKIGRLMAACPFCRNRGFVGCHSCWNEPGLIFPDNEFRIGVLRAGRDAGIIPDWITDRGLIRAFDSTRSEVCRSFYQWPLCQSCGDAGNSTCLVCLGKQLQKCQPSVSLTVSPR